MNNLPPRDEAEEVRREASVHGAAWGQNYGGYFGDAKVAGPFLEELERALGARPAGAVADLGGGTGFVLMELMKSAPPGCRRRYVDIDLSEAQLAQVSDPRIEKHCVSLTEFTRGLIGAETEEILFCTRSTLHYFGIFGLKPLLAHLRAQMRPGEHFVHQSVCADEIEDALLLSEFMERIGSGKWVLPLESFEAAAAGQGLAPLSRRRAAPLPMPDETVARRYGLPLEKMRSICEMLSREYQQSRLLGNTAAGWVLSAPYWIFTCRAE